MLTRQIGEAERARAERTRRSLESADETLAALAERAERRAMNGSAEAERRAERLRQDIREGDRPNVPTRPKPAPAPQMDPSASTAWNRWVDARIGTAIKRFGEGIADEAGALLATLKREIDAMAEMYVEQQGRIAALERKLAELTAAPAKRAGPRRKPARVALPAPRLVDDAA